MFLGVVMCLVNGYGVHAIHCATDYFVDRPGRSSVLQRAMKFCLIAFSGASVAKGSLALQSVGGYDKNSSITPATLSKQKGFWDFVVSVALNNLNDDYYLGIGESVAPVWCGRLRVGTIQELAMER